MERKSLVPLVREVCPIVKKTKVSVKEQKRQLESLNEKGYKGIFGPTKEEALREANRIADENAPERKISSKLVVEEEIQEGEEIEI